MGNVPRQEHFPWRNANPKMGNITHNLQKVFTYL